MAHDIGAFEDRSALRNAASFLRRLLLRRLLFSIFVLAHAQFASAALVSAQGNGFTLVYDEAITGLFGTPMLGGTDNQSIRFIPGTSGSGFRAAGGVDRAGTIAFDIIPDSGLTLSGLSLTERGDYSLLDADPSSGSSPAVLIVGSLRLNALSDPGNEWSANLQATDLSMAGLNNPWQATAQLATGAQDLFTGAVWQGSTTAVTITLQNELYSLLNDPLDIAAIEKKLLILDLGFDTAVPVPLPGSVFLLGGALLFFCRRRNHPIS